MSELLSCEIRANVLSPIVDMRRFACVAQQHWAERTVAVALPCPL
jgi:hypothetical protein